MYKIYDLKRGYGSLSALFAFLQMTQPSGAGATFVPRHQGTDQSVLSNTAHGLLITIECPTGCIELRPIYLSGYGLVTLLIIHTGKTLTYNIPWLVMKCQHHVPTIHHKMINILSGQTVE